MNDILHLKGRFEQKANPSRPSSPELPANTFVPVEHIESLINNLEALKSYWTKENVLPGALISVFYIDVIAKSRRISATFSKNKVTANESIVGAKFINDGKLKHVITHYIDMNLLDITIQKYKQVLDIIMTRFGRGVSDRDVKNINAGKVSVQNGLLSKTEFVKIVIDAHYVEKFGISYPSDIENKDSIITIYNTGIDTVDLLHKLGIDLLPRRVMDDTTILVTPDQLSILKQKAPYLISMAVNDISQLPPMKENYTGANCALSIPSPTNEPVVGVIDTLFDTGVYFSKWVDFKNMVDPNIPVNENDYKHGTAVSSIIVDGPSINPDLDDGCGRFRVRHFGVTVGNSFSSFSILQSINEIVTSNRDIKVWNLSLGSALPINPNFISPEAAILDKIQYENDVIFVIAGTNKGDDVAEEMSIGAPADSINSIVVNSVTRANEPANYSRVGPVLSFFVKPDVAYYGGDNDNPMRVCTPTGESFLQGTSFAAPWISRKMSYLINVMGLSREIAKALLIDSATGWTKEKVSPNILGYGVVPQHINDIIKTPSDEIKFVLYGVSEQYDTYTYNIPVPVASNKHPFIAKATMCYFPYCSRNQGVDYTNTELDVKFGRIKKNEIRSIDNNYQDKAGCYMYEGAARRFYRKWDNVKHVREIVKNNRAKDVYTGIWGLSIKTKERTQEKFGTGLTFGVVITLKEIKGANRIDEFIRLCSLKGWLVSHIDVHNRIDIYNAAQQDVILENE